MYTDLEEPPRKPRQIRGTPLFRMRSIYAAIFTLGCALTAIPIHYILYYKYRDLKEEGFLGVDDETLNRRFLMRVGKLGYSAPERLTPDAAYKIHEEASI